MLLNSFFRIEERSSAEGNHQFRLSSDPSHEVYNGHFPGNPVTPGVFQVQMIHELAAEICGTPLRLVSADNIKYLQMMVPSLHKEFNCQMTFRDSPEGEIIVNSTLFSGETIFIKFRGKFVKDA